MRIIIIWAGSVVNCTKKGVQTVKRALLLVLQSLYKSVKNDVQRKPDQRANVIRRFVGGRGKDPLGDQRLWIESTGRRIETNRQGSIDVWAASSVFPLPDLACAPLSLSTSDGGVRYTWRGDWERKTIRCYIPQPDEGRMDEKTFFPL